MREQAKFFWAGVRSEIPLLIGGFPEGMIYGALALNAGLSTAAAQMMSFIVFAGSAQFVTAQLVHDAAPGFVIVLTIAVVNLRHMLYSASLAPYLASLSTRWKALLSYLLTDEAYAPTIIRYEREGITPYSHWFLFGAGFSLWTTWQVSTALGIFVGAALPEFMVTGFCPAVDLHCDGCAGIERETPYCGSIIRWHCRVIGIFIAL